MSPRVLVVIPAFCEGTRVGKTVQSVRDQGFDVLLVDDGSTDNTREVAIAAGADVLRLDDNRGKGAALQSGFSEATRRGAEVVITLDADGQHDPAEIPSFMQKMQESGADVVMGNRMLDERNMPFVRRITNRLMSSFLSLLMRQRVPDTQNGFRLYAARVLPVIRSQSRGFAAESEQLLHVAKGGYRIESVPIRTIYGDEESKIHPFRDSVRFVNMVLRFMRQ